MIDPAMVRLAVEQEGVRRPDHRDVAVDLDRGRAGEAFLEFLRARFDAGGEIVPAQMADLAGAVGLFDGDGGAAVGAKLGADRLSVIGNASGRGRVWRDVESAVVG